MTLAESKGVNLSNYGVTVTRDSNGFITSVDAPMQNLSSQQIMGVDLSTMYRFHHVRFSVDHSQFLYFLEEGFPGAGMRNKLGENGRPPWRDAAAIEYLINDQQTLGLLALTTAGQDKADPTQGTIPNYTTYDLNYTYKVNSKTSYSIGIRNIFATTPPLDNSNPEAELNTSLYDQIGRQLVAGYKQGF
jgi:outer membrane receptor protein involved in Fe transport